MALRFDRSVPLYQGPAQREAFGSIVATPADQMNAANALDGDVGRVDADITNAYSAGKVPDDFYTQWQSFLAGWNSFKASLGGASGWVSRFLTAGPLEQINSYRAQLVTWQTRFQALGGAVAGPAVAPPPANGLGIDLTKVAWIVGGLVLIVLVPRLLPKR